MQIKNFTIKKSTALLIAVFFLFFDRFLKIFILKTKIELLLIPSFLKLSFVPNPYIAFSIPVNGITLNIIIATITIAFVYLFIREFNSEYTLKPLGLLLIILGSASNLYDRIAYGYVIDYIDLKYFTVFNIADSIIFIGVSLLLIVGFKSKPAKPQSPASPQIGS